MARLKELEDENRRLKKMYAEEQLMSEARKEALEKSGEVCPQAGAGACRSGFWSAQYQAGLSGELNQRNLLPLSVQTVQ